MATQERVEEHDVQGIVVSGYGHLDYGGYLFIRLADEVAQAQAWLKALLPEVSSGAPWAKDASGDTIKPDRAVCVALTCPGVAALGVPAGDIETFPHEFRAGIADETRSRILGDTGESAPENWQIGGKDPQNLHAIVMILAQTAELRDELVAAQTALVEAHGGAVAATETGAKLWNDREHFGFMDGVSQPKIRGTARTADVAEPTLPAGEFILGYTNLYGQIPNSPRLRGRDLGRNGTYIVFRKLHQDVAAFWNYISRNAYAPERDQTEEDARVWLASKMVGRWPSGVPLTLSPDKDDPEFDPTKINSFYFRERDPHGDYMPLGSHVRRSNPRDSDGPTAEEALLVADRHLIIRRGMPYGEPLIDLENLPPGRVEDDGADRGLLFFCINANIERQFEFVQQTWLNNTKFHGLYTDKDPIAGDADGRNTLTLQRDPVRQQVQGFPRFVTVRGGAYAFMPGLAALKRLAGDD